ncbi:MAG: DUF5693 family protein [Selenomonadales bacterium]|nr:DUF5693 family protein [Selenomonadales bacterium]
MKDFKYNRILMIIILIGFVASMAINLERHRVEEANNTVELAIDYEGLVELAEREGVPRQEVFAQAKEAGICSMAVYDTQFKKLNVNGKATAWNGSTIIANYQNGALADPAWCALVEDGTIKGTNVYVTGHHEQTFKEVHEDLLRRLGDDRVRELTIGKQQVLEVKANYTAFIKMDLGLPTDEMQEVNAAGFHVIARPTNFNHCTREDVDAVFKRLDGIDVSDIVFSGSQALGAPDEADYTADKMMERGITLGMIEGVTQLQFFPQDGLLDIARDMDYKSARFYTIAKEELEKLKIDDAVERWSNTDAERNIRINLLRIYEKPAPGMSLLETNMTYFAAVRDQLVAHGYKIGPAATYEHFYPSALLRAVVMAGVAAAMVLYLSLVVPALKPKYMYGLLAILMVGMMAPVLMGHGNKIRLIAAFASANVFPAIAIIWQLDRIRSRQAEGNSSLIKIFIAGAIALFASGVVSYVGASYLSGSLADTEYLLEVNIFRGVKLTFVLPLVLVAIAFLQRFDVFDGKMDDTDGVIAQAKKILDMPVKIKTLFIMLLVLAAGVVFVARSGHTMGMPVSGAELQFRAFLEKAMYARPRSKELMIGHPAFMLAAMAWFRKWPTMVLFALVIVATIGMGSMVETFAHMRSPVFMSFARGIGGIVLGCGVGAIAMMMAEAWNSFISPRLK